MNPRVAVITPTYKRESKILQRCIKSVQWQTYPNIVHYVCHDGPWSKNSDIQQINHLDYPLVTWMNTPTRTDSYGAGVRQFVMDNLPEGIDYLVHFDDDNVIFPEYVEEHVACLESHPDAAFSVCKIVHNGPLPAHMGEAPKILTGIPPVFKNIDTLQIMVRTSAMKACGWTQYTGDKGYCNDGYTYQRLGEMFSYVALPKLLAVHI